MRYKTVKKKKKTLCIISISSTDIRGRSPDNDMDLLSTTTSRIPNK